MSRRRRTAMSRRMLMGTLASCPELTHSSFTFQRCYGLAGGNRDANEEAEARAVEEGRENRHKKAKV